MQVFSIILVSLMLGLWVLGAVSGCISSWHETGRRRWLKFAGWSFMGIGGIGFFGSALSACGGLNWLPSSFEWPVGYVSGVVTTGNEMHVVPHHPCNRIQVYDTNWKFVKGWHVDAGGGTFKIIASEEDRFDVITARGSWHYVFNTNGDLISKVTYSQASYGSFPDEGRSVVVPTAPWLWLFSDPSISWCVMLLGMVMLGLMDKLVKRRKATSG